MRVLRIILSGLIAVTVLVAGFVAATVVVVVTGLVAFLVRLVWGPKGVTRAGPVRGSNRRSEMATSDVIDVVATKVPADRGEIPGG